MVDFYTWQQLAGEMAALPLLFNAPLSERHAARLIDDLNLHEKCYILDLGCGWGELLLRALATMPGAIGVGVDHDLATVSRARVAAVERNLLQRATFVCADLLTYTGPPSDVVFAIGIGHTTRSPRHALTIIKDRLLPGGSALYADGYWKRPPTVAERAAIGSHSRELGSLGELCADAAAVGFDVLCNSVADDDELQSYAQRTRAGLLRRLWARGTDYEREVIGRQEALWRDVLQSLEGVRVPSTQTVLTTLRCVIRICWMELRSWQRRSRRPRSKLCWLGRCPWGGTKFLESA